MNAIRLIPANCAAFSCDILPCVYQSIAAARRISWLNSFGDRCKAAKASSGKSIVTVAMRLNSSRFLRAGFGSPMIAVFDQGNESLRDVIR
jgi:hypothetical protein